MNEQNIQNNENVSEEVEVLEVANEEAQDSYGAVSELLDIPEYVAEQPKKCKLSKAILPLIVAALLALLGISHIGLNGYNAYKDYNKVLEENTFDKFYEEQHISSLEQSMSQYGMTFDDMLEAEGKTREEYFAELKESNKEDYDKQKAEWTVMSEKEIFEPAKETLIDEISSAVMIGAIFLALAEITRNIATLRINKADK